ncbi:P-loop containing nucleoside triphosphate hydrolase protein [Aspergillus piperis CBS 112811]|uniref:P-loop containing nucleoside triphosphate hydrolase protein n=1 Tax=Aspergillus piperis CBS 112811 TaxID=1448313 RepID=A0A8G1VGS6_9EURO|nr:P-loop containing nucleoside triphosphate hydrolase protein [Aspergillus piperis CBS 112811]RAH51920.1 P-loop containing nucleoside triphosphate hydrolase protein [Aspergillus piperis CBS 112811]
MIYTIGLRGSLLAALTISSLCLSDPPAAIGLTITQLLLPRRPHLFTPDGRAVDLENSSSAFYRYTMHWCTSALHLAGNHVKLDKLPALNYYTRSQSQSLLQVATSKTSLWYRILYDRFAGFAKQWIIMLIRSLVTFVSPYCVMRLLRSLEEQLESRHDAWFWLIGIAISCLCQTLLHHHLLWIQWSEMAIPVRAQLIMAIFAKALKMKDYKDPQSPKVEKPEAINLISSDSASLSKFTAVNHYIPATLSKFLFAALFLVQLVEWQGTLAALVVTAISVPVHTFVIKQERMAQKHLAAARDKKTKAINELMYALRQIKFSASEAQWEDRLETFRQDELKQLRRVFVAKNVRSVWCVASPFIVAAASISMYAYTTSSISPSILFPMIELLPHLQSTLGFLPVVFNDYFEARSNGSRIENYLRRPEHKTVLTPSSSGHISFHNATISWPSDVLQQHRFSLSHINVDFRAGELSIIYGKTGSGKSLVLAAIIGEVDLLEGTIKAPSMAEGQSVAFVSQTPWLQNTTIRENILFGNPMDDKKYEEVLKACALYPDLAALPKGDETQIGLRGVKLSGGQRARLALARALYSSAQTLVLDDIFASLDAHVSRDICKALTGALCRGRTRILVTHQVSLCLPEANCIVHVENNTAKYAEGAEFVVETQSEVETENSMTADLPRQEKSKERATTLTKSKGLDARTDAKVYDIYFTVAGGLRFTIIYLLGLVIKQLLGSLTTRTLGRINSARPESISLETDVPPVAPYSKGGWEQYLYLYLLASTTTVLLEFLFNLHAYSGSLRASHSLFRAATLRVLRMPLHWLDSTPIGEILRRLTVDAKNVDDYVLVTMSEFADNFVQMTLIVCVGFNTSKYMSLLTLTLLYWCIKVSKLYIKARTTVKRADSEPTAAILEHFTSSAAGVMTIRAFGASDRLAAHMHGHIDRLSTARRHFFIFNRWLSLQMSLIGVIFSVGTGIILLSTSTADAFLIGYCLSYSVQLSQAMFKAINNYGMLETYMNSAGNIIAYTELEPEKQGGREAPNNWPSLGNIEVKSLGASYAPGLPLVLEDVSFSVKGRERVGIVGRTGAGKSSLTLALLRLIEPQHGSIVVDGIDITTLALQTLRSRIAFIPQDPVLFSGTVRSNLDYSHQISEDRLNDALQRVKLLRDDPEDEDSGLFTLDSRISAGGANMSQGQRQLLCVARILISYPKIIILDEATSAVDDETDRWIQDTIRSQFSGTLIVVAHRLRTISSFDKVIAMSEGKIAEMGSPAELLRKEGLFYDLVQSSEDREYLMETIG